MNRPGVAVACALLLAACATSTAQRAQERALERQLDGFRHAQPLDGVWHEARRLLVERGYPLAGKDADAVGQKRTSWAERITSPARETAERGPLRRALDTGWNRYRERYHVEGRGDGGGCQVVFTRLQQDPTDRRSEASRDVRLELELVRRVDPAAATRLEEGLRPAALGAR